MLPNGRSHPSRRSCAVDSLGLAVRLLRPVVRLLFAELVDALVDEFDPLVERVV